MPCAKACRARSRSLAFCAYAVVGAVVLARRPPTVHAEQEDETESELSA